MATHTTSPRRSSAAAEAPAQPRWPPAGLPEWRAALRRLPIADREALAPLFSRPALRAARLAQRDEAILHWLAGKSGDASDLARQVHRALSIYAGGQWRHERDRAEPHDPRNRLLHRALQAGHGKIPAVHSLRKLIARRC